MCTVTVIHYCTEDCQLLIVHCSSHQSIASYLPLLWGPHRKIAVTFGMEKLEWFGYPMVKILKILKMCLFVLTEFTNVTDALTDHSQTDTT